MPEKTEETKPLEKKGKGVLGKLQEITPDKDEQVALIGVAVRLGIVVWSGFILTLAYVDLPGFQKQNFDPTFIASVFSGSLAAFGLAPSKNGGGSGGKLGPQKAPPIPDKGKTDPISGKKIDPQSGKLIL